MPNSLPRTLRNASRRRNVTGRLARFGGWTSRSDRSAADGRGYDHTETVNDYYDLCNDFMQFGWSESLHFAPLTPGETVEASIVRHQRLMIEKLQLRKGLRVVDVGCGAGGPMRRVASESGARVLCINNNEQQFDQARRRNKEAGLDHLAEYMKCSFMDLSAIDADSFDAGYAIESTCHAPDKQRAFAEIFRILKPGALFWGQEMCMTDRFDPLSPKHQAIRDELMFSIALSEIATFAEVNRALEAVGFEVVEARDRGVEDGSGTPWYAPMDGLNGSFRHALRATRPGRRLILGGLRIAEAMRLLPKGQAAVVSLMDRTARAYVAGGKPGIFSPLYCFLARKPE